MALKLKITKEEFDKLSDVIKAEYLTDGEGYKLDALGLEDTGPLKRAHERVKAELADVNNKLSDAEKQISTLFDPKKAQDINLLTKSYEKKLEDQKAEFEATNKKNTGFITKTLLDSKAESLANELAGKNAKLILPHIKSRLAADFEGDEPVTRVLDDKGQVSASTIDDLKKEFVANKDFSSIIIGSKASGGAGNPKQSTQFNGGANPNEKPADLSKMNPRELADHIKAKKESESES